MSWAFGFDEDDSFVPMDFGEPLFDPTVDRVEDQVSDTPSFFYLPPQARFVTEQQDAGGVREVPPPTENNRGIGFRDTSVLANENAMLRQTAMTLKERFAQIASLNENLKGQLEECQSKFKNLMFSGFSGPRK
jgi:hypothetical protein